MKIIVPEFIMPTLRDAAGEILASCEFVTLNREGEFSGNIAGAEVVMLPWNLPAETRYVLLNLPTLKWIHTVSAGVEHTLDERLQALDIPLTNARGVFDLPIAETTLAYILMIVKRMPEFLAQQRARTWRKHALREAAGLTVGLVGLGSIGMEIARLCHGLGMRVLATRRHPERAAAYVDEVFSGERLGEMLAASDFVVIAVPLTTETRGLIGEAQLRQMKATAWLINIARGAVVDESALVTALREGWIAGAALDVFVAEPLPEESPLWALDNVILTPHNSWSTPHLQEREAALFLDNLSRYLSGAPLRNVVDKDLGY